MLWSPLFYLSICLIGSARSHQCTAFTQCLPLTLTGTTSSQSSDYKYGGVNYTSERAIDGDSDVCAATITLSKSWWRIDLMGVYNISNITIYNKPETVNNNNNDINGAQIYVGSSRKDNGTTNSICENITNFAVGTWNNFTCITTISGRYITVFMPEDKPVILCEVMIYGTKKDSPFVLINETKTWEEALYYCRDHHMDLASIVDEDTQAWAELEAKKANTPFVWLGLHYTCTLEFWFWVDNQRLDFSRWKAENKTGDCGMSGAMETREEHLWFSTSDSEKFNFICAVKGSGPAAAAV